MKSLVILGDDKIAGAVSEQVSGTVGCIVYVDRSTGLSRIVKLVQRRVISPILLAKMVICEMFRKGKKPDGCLPSIACNADLLRAISEHQPDRLVLFRAGLIINQAVINAGTPVFNIHAAIVPDFGGIGSIDRALQASAYDQYASMHIVTVRIDEGEVVDKYPYSLEPRLCYCKNELLAYQAGQKLLLKAIGAA